MKGKIWNDMVGEGAYWEGTPTTEYLLGVRPQLQPMPLPQLPYTILIFMHTSIHADILTCTHTGTHAYIHTCTHACTHSPASKL